MAKRRLHPAATAAMAVAAAMVLAMLLACAHAKGGDKADDDKAGDKDEYGPTCDKARKLFKKSKLYDVLGVKKTAKQKEIRRGFKKMSIKCHPDKDRENENAQENFIAIAGAYETLGNEDERKRYDLFGAGGGGGGESNGGFQWKPKNAEDINVDDIFKEFFKTGGSGTNDGPLAEMLKNLRSTFRDYNKDARKRQAKFREQFPDSDIDIDFEIKIPG
jgi:DnaJ-class molecular chaperone